MYNVQYFVSDFLLIFTLIISLGSRFHSYWLIKSNYSFWELSHFRFALSISGDKSNASLLKKTTWISNYVNSHDQDEILGHHQMIRDKSYSYGLADFLEDVAFEIICCSFNNSSKINVCYKEDSLHFLPCVRLKSIRDAIFFNQSGFFRIYFGSSQKKS